MADPLTPNQQAPADRIDPNVTMPPHVAKAIAAGQAAHTSVYNGAQPNGAQPNGQQPNGAAPAELSQPELPLVPPELPETNADGSVNWENRFKALKGRYDHDSRQWNETIGQYEERMRGMQGDLHKATQPPLPGSGDIPSLVTQKEIADYGADMIDVIKRAATEAIIPMLKPIAQTVGQMQARVETTESEAGRQFLNRMNGSMDQMVPGWGDINKDPNFIAWTKQNDVFSGLNRQELLQRAWYAGDSNRVAAFFQGFLAEEAAIDPAASRARQQAFGGNVGHAPGPAPNGHQPAPRVTLESLAAPGRARAADATPVGKPVWTAAGISQFYMDVAAGKFRGRDQERAATEADLMAAQREGRIQVDPRTATQVGR